MSTETQTGTNVGATATPSLVADDFDENAYVAMSASDRRAYLGDDAGEASEAPAKVESTAKAVTETKTATGDDDAADGEITISTDGKVGRNDKTGRFVPYEVYGKTRGRAKDAETALQKEREERALEKGRYTELSNLLGLMEKTGAIEPKAAAKAEAAKAINPKEDVIGAVEAMLSEIEGMKKNGKEREEADGKARERRDLNNFFESDVAKFRTTNPDFEDALTHLIKVKHAELEAHGIADKGTRDQMLLQATEDLISNAKAGGNSAAERIYAMATKAFGYTKKDATQQVANATSDAEKKIAAVKSGMAASPSLSGAGGAAPENLDLAKMSEDEYSNLMARLSPAQRRKLLGSD